MRDFVEGPVGRVLDGDTFDITVTHVGVNNAYEYNAEERIRIARMDAPELGSLLGGRSAIALTMRLTGKRVRCHVHARDTFQRLVADVQVLS